MKICTDCGEAIELSRLEKFPLADKCSICAAPLASKRKSSVPKHIPKSEERSLVKLNSKRLLQKNVSFSSRVCPECGGALKRKKENLDYRGFDTEECILGCGYVGVLG